MRDFLSRRLISSPRSGAKRPERRAHLSVEQLEDRTCPTVSISTGFNGINMSQGGSNVPPDTIAAAGPTAVVEMVNNALAFYDRSGNPLAAVQSLANFFNTSNLQSDVRVYYDDAAQVFNVNRDNQVVKSRTIPIMIFAVPSPRSRSEPSGKSRVR